MSSGGRAQTRIQILEAARAMFEALGYHDSGLAAVAKAAGVSRQAIYLHFPSKVELLSALHLHIFATDVVPAIEKHPITVAMTAWEAIDASIAVDVEVVAKVWRVHEVLAMARRQHPEVDQTLLPREKERYDELLELGLRLEREGGLPPTIGAGVFVDMLWGLVNAGTYRSLVIEREWTPDRYEQWVRTTLRLHTGLSTSCAAGGSVPTVLTSVENGPRGAARRTIA